MLLGISAIIYFHTPQYIDFLDGVIRSSKHFSISSSMHIQIGWYAVFEHENHIFKDHDITNWDWFCWCFPEIVFDLFHSFPVFRNFFAIKQKRRKKTFKYVYQRPTKFFHGSSRNYVSQRIFPRGHLVAASDSHYSHGTIFITLTTTFYDCFSVNNEYKTPKRFFLLYISSLLFITSTHVHEFLQHVLILYCIGILTNNLELKIMQYTRY